MRRCCAIVMRFVEQNASPRAITDSFTGSPSCNRANDLPRGSPETARSDASASVDAPGADPARRGRYRRMRSPEAVMIEIRRILCPIDFSDFSRRALDHAIAIARWYASSVTALYVFSPAPVAAFRPGPVAFEPIVLTAADRDQLLADTKAFIEAEAAPGVALDAVVREGNPAAEIVDQATDMNAALLVMGTHGRSGFERLLLGSVAEKVLRKARCPVLTVPRRLPDAVPSGPVVFKRIICAFLVGVLHRELLGDGDAVVAHDRLAPLLFNEHTPGSGTQRDPHGVCDGCGASQHFLPGLGSEQEMFMGHSRPHVARTSRAEAASATPPVKCKH